MKNLAFIAIVLAVFALPGFIEWITAEPGCNIGSAEYCREASHGFTSFGGPRDTIDAILGHPCGNEILSGLDLHLYTGEFTYRTVDLIGISCCSDEVFNTCHTIYAEEGNLHEKAWEAIGKINSSIKTRQ